MRTCAQIRRFFRTCGPGFFLLLAASTVFGQARSGRPPGQTERYRLTVTNTWSEANHPGAFPQYAHFSYLAGGLHDDTVSFWDEGVQASPGIVQMAETGATSVLEAEVHTARAAGSADTVLASHRWTCPAITDVQYCGALVIELEVTDTHPLVTLVTMLGPSPDWFVGVSGLPLRVNRRWRDRVVVQLRPYDGGTREANLFELGGPLTIPPDPVARITTGSGQLVGPGSLGTMVFERLGELGTSRSPGGSNDSTGTGGFVRNGSGVNPLGYTEVTRAAINSTWQTSVDIVTPAANVSVVRVFLGGPLAALSPGSGELLCAPPALRIDVALGSHSIAIPNDPVLVGLEFCTQAATVTWTPFRFQLQNAIDVRIDTF